MAHDKPTLFVGLMSGTSMDGADGVLADLAPGGMPRILAHASRPMPGNLRQEFMALNAPGHDELARSAMAGTQLARLYAEVVRGLLQKSGRQAGDIAAIGAHGQTVRHAPESGYTIQINNAALLAELTGITVIADFRVRDVACGGQGAPLVPAFHEAVFAAARARAVLNLGGMANVTLLEPGRAVRGFDTGPGNALLDLWCQRHTGRSYDADGAWGALGRVHEGLLAALLAEPWFRQPPPKSTGRDLFNMPWLKRHLDRYGIEGLDPMDVQATLQALTARSIACALQAHAGHVDEVVVCGGGVFNGALMAALKRELHCRVIGSSELGIPEQLVEALAFAWLAQAHLDGVPAGLPSVTGARKASVLGCKVPA